MYLVVLLKIDIVSVYGRFMFSVCIFVGNSFVLIIVLIDV